MKKHTIFPAVAAAVLLCAAMPVYAEPDDAANDDIVMLYTDTRSKKQNANSPLCAVINQQRAEKGIAALTQTEALMELAAVRVEKLYGNQGGADAAALETSPACETVIRGSADINTAICAMLISEQQQKPLFCEAYTQFGYACSADNRLWVFLFTA